MWLSRLFCLSAVAKKSKLETAEPPSIPGFGEVIAFELKSMPAAELDREKAVELGNPKGAAGF